MALLFGLLAFVIAVHWIERDSFRDNLDGQMSFSDVIYFTMISATTTGYGDIVPVTDRARLFDALVVTPIRMPNCAQALSWLFCRSTPGGEEMARSRRLMA